MMYNIAVRIWLYVAIIVWNSCRIGFCQQQTLMDIGPRNITRYAGETNVYIPCPFSGPANPIWTINGIEYGAFNLPNNMLPVSYGLLIRSVEHDMDGKTFQCISPEGPPNARASTVGKLTVEKLPKGYNDAYISWSIVEDTQAVLSLDHQRMSFEADSKTIAWRTDGKQSGCTIMEYNLTSLTCNDTKQQTFIRIHDTAVDVGSDFFVDSRNNNSLYINLQSQEDIDTVCQELQYYFTVKPLDITEKVSTTYKGVCVEFVSQYYPHIVLPSKTLGADCSCPINLINDTYNLSRCHCRDDIIFVNSVNITRRVGNPDGYNMCFSNITQEMNDTVIHIYESYRECTNFFGAELTVAYRTYIYSMRLMIDLPTDLNISVNTTSGEVVISVDAIDEIHVDHFKVFVSDVTNLIVRHRRLDGDDHNVTFGTLFEDPLCSPYNVTVKAYNAANRSITRTKIINSGSTTYDDRSRDYYADTDKCKCIEQYVDVELNLGSSDIPQNSKLHVLVNCSQDHYEDTVYVNVTILSEGINKNVSIVTCKENAIYLHIPSLSCGASYDLHASLMYDPQSTCTSYIFSSKNNRVPCPGPAGKNYALVAGIPVLAILLLISMVIIIFMCVKANYKKKKTEEFEVSG